MNRGPDPALWRSGFMVMVTVMVVKVSVVLVMVPHGSERRTGQHHDDQSCQERPSHGKNLARRRLAQKRPEGPASRD
jgi:uncharacterized membrane protein